MYDEDPDAWKKHKPSELHEALQFHVQTFFSGKGGGGATMDVNSRRFYRPGEPAYFVGGEPDVEGNRIPTSYAKPHEVTLSRIIDEAHRVHKATGGREGANLGSWVNPETKNVEFDASSLRDTRREAKREGKRRLQWRTDEETGQQERSSEWGVYDNKRGRTIRTSWPGQAGEKA